MPDFLADILYRPQNRELLTLIKTAFNWHRLPSWMLHDYLEGIDEDVVASLDRRLALAHDVLIAETCQGCGVPIWLGHSEIGEYGVFGLEFDTDAVSCFACATLEGYRADNRSKHEKSPEAMYGVTEYVLPSGWRAIDNKVVYSSDYLPSREDSMRDMARRKKNMADREAEANKEQ